MAICAERVAFTKAISEGERDFDYIVVCGGRNIENLEDCLPCGYIHLWCNGYKFVASDCGSDFELYTEAKNGKM